MKDLPINQYLKQGLNTLGKRYQVLAEDIGHVNTPGRKARDLDPKALEGKNSGFQHQIKMARTNPGHIVHVTSTGPQPKVKVDKSKGNMDLQGNNIDMESTLEKITETSINYEERATLLRSNFEMIRMMVKR